MASKSPSAKDFMGSPSAKDVACSHFTSMAIVVQLM
jgi:hypothetical protein